MGQLPVRVRIRHVRKRIDRRFRLRNTQAPRKHFSLWWMVALAIVMITFFWWKSPSAQQPDVVAMLNGQPVTIQDLQRYQQLRFLPPTESAYITEQYINEQLLLAEAQRRGIVVSAEDVHQLIQEALAAQGVGVQDLERALRERNLQMSDLQQRYREQLTITQLIDALGTAPPTEEEIQQFYAQYQQAFAGKSLSEAQETIVLLIQQQQRQNALPELIRQLRSTAEIEIYGQRNA